jgi:hypothetical protein
VCTATVIQEVLTSNVAREASLSAGIPNSVPGHTVTLACIGSNVATATGVDKIKTGQAEVFLAGGVETMSDVPIRFSRPIRKRLIRSTKMKTPAQYLSLLSGLKVHTPQRHFLTRVLHSSLTSWHSAAGRGLRTAGAWRGRVRDRGDHGAQRRPPLRGVWRVARGPGHVRPALAPGLSLFVSSPQL